MIVFMGLHNELSELLRAEMLNLCISERHSNSPNAEKSKGHYSKHETVNSVHIFIFG